MKPILPSLRDLVRGVCAVALLALVAGCGNKGPLVPPKATLSIIASTGNLLSESEARSQC